MKTLKINLIDSSICRVYYFVATCEIQFSGHRMTSIHINTFYQYRASNKRQNEHHGNALLRRLCILSLIPIS